MLPADAGFAFVTFYPAIVVCFYLCGSGPGALVAALSAIAAYQFFVPESEKLDHAIGESFAILTFLLSAFLIGLIVKRLQDYSTELKATYFTLQQSERRYHDMLEDQTEVICRFKADGIMLYINEAYCRLFGVTRENLLGHHWRPVVWPEDIPLVTEKLNSLSPSNPVVMVENRIFGASGEVRWGQFVNRAFFDTKGQLTEIQAVGRDITERKQLEDKLIASKHETEDLYDHAPCGYHSLGPDGTILRMNATELAWLGYSRDEVVGKMKIHDFYTPEGKELFQKTFPIFLRNGHIEDLQFDIVGKNGMLRQVMLSATAIYDDHGKFVMSRTVVYDISELKKVRENLEKTNRQLEEEIKLRKASESALLISREEYRKLVDTMAEGLVVCNSEGDITFVNEMFCKFINYSSAQIIGHPLPDFIKKPELLAEQQFLARHNNEELNQFEIELQGNSKRRIWAKISPRSLFDRYGTFVGYFAVITDISDHKKAERSLRRSQSELRLLSAQVMTAQEMERKRIASELHDGIGQTLSAVKFNIENAVQRLRAGATEEGLQQFDGIIPKMQRAVEDVRRIAMDLRPSILDDIGVLATLAWFCREFQSIYSHIRIEPLLDIREEDIPPPLKVAIFRISQEAMNNCAKHGAADCIDLSLVKTEHAIELSIEDNGQGFDYVEIRERIKDVTGGLGLGTMRERAEFSGGHFHIETAKGKGTQIHVVWPCRKEKQKPGLHQPGAPTSSP